MEDEQLVSVLSDTWRRTMCKGLQEMRFDGHLCDTHILAAGDVQLKAHAIVLSACSPYFRSLFGSVKQGFFTVKIEHVAPNILLVVLHFIYTGELKTKSCELSQLVSIAKQLELRKLETMCVELQKSQNGKMEQKLKEETHVLIDADVSNNARCGDNNYDISSLTGSWTVSSSNNQGFVSPRSASRTPTPITPISRTPTPKNSSRTSTPRASGTAINSGVRMNSSTVLNAPTWTASGVSPKRSGVDGTSNVAQSSVRRKDGTEGQRDSMTLAEPNNKSSSMGEEQPGKCNQSQFGEKVRPFSCPICGRKYGSMKGVNWHLQAHHGVSSARRVNSSSSSNEKKPQCKICGRFFPQLNYLHLHEKCHRTDVKKAYTSPLATIGYHRHQPDESGRYVCKVCGRAFLRSQALGSHMWCHLPHGRYGKRQLKRSQEINGAVQNAIKGHEESRSNQYLNAGGNEPAVVEIELDDRANKEEDSQHNSASNNSVPGRQDQIRRDSFESNKSDAGSSHGNHNKWSHAAEGMFKPKANSEKKSLYPTERKQSESRLDNDSLKNGAPEEPDDFESESGNIEAEDLSALSTADRKKLFGCEYCGREFLYSSSLRAHRRLHTGEKPYTCKSCGKTFRWYSVFSRHNCEQYGERAKGSDENGRKQISAVDVKKEPEDEDEELVTGNAGTTASRNNKILLGRFSANRKPQLPERRERNNAECDLDIESNARSDWTHHSSSDNEPANAANFLSGPYEEEGLLLGGRPNASMTSSPSEATSTMHSDNLPQPVPAGHGDKWSCPICGNVYKSLYFVKNHMRIVHGGQKRYSCPLCNKRFGYSNVLRDHMKLHELQMPAPVSSVSHVQTPAQAHDWSSPGTSVHLQQPSWANNAYNSAQQQQHWSPGFMPPPPSHHMHPTSQAHHHPHPSWPPATSGLSPRQQAWPPTDNGSSLPSWTAGPSHGWSGSRALRRSAWPGETSNMPSMSLVGNGPAAWELAAVAAGQEVLQCRACHESFDSQMALVAHVDRCHKEPSAVASNDRSYFVCGLENCSELFASHDELRSHRQQMHGTSSRDRKSYPCTYCTRVLYSYGGWKLHEMIHRGEKPLKCKYCPYNARSSANMYSHIQSRHKGRSLLGYGKIA